jgi:hypothetical protein
MIHYDVFRTLRERFNVLGEEIPKERKGITKESSFCLDLPLKVQGAPYGGLILDDNRKGMIYRKRSPSKCQAQGFRGEMQRSRSKNKPTDEHYKALETKYQQQLDGKAAWKGTTDSKKKGRGRERNQREVWMPGLLIRK